MRLCGVTATRFGTPKAVPSSLCHLRRNPDTVPDTILRDMIRNWNREAARTRAGYYRNLSLKPYRDPFTGEVRGANPGTAPRVLQQQPAGEGDAAKEMGPPVDAENLS